MSQEALLKTANPAPLGLLGFGMATVMLNLANVDVFPVDITIIGMGLFVGGLAQFMAGLFSFRAGNTFNATAFCSYGVFWWSLTLCLVSPQMTNIPAPDNLAMAFYFLCWAVYTGFMFIGTLKGENTVKFVFATLTILLLLLALQRYDLDNSVWGFIAGIDGIACGASAMWAAVAFVINEQFGRKVVPV